MMTRPHPQQGMVLVSGSLVSLGGSGHRWRISLKDIGYRCL